MSNMVQFPALGLEFEVNRVAFSIGGFDVYWYGLLIGSGMLLAIVFAFSNCRSFGIDDNKLVDVVFLTTILAVVCARAYYVIFAPYEYDSFWDIINIRDGGLAIYGAVIGAAVFGYLFCKLRKVPVLPTFDIAFMGFLIGQGIGRWGNFFNQEAFGTNTNSIFGMYSLSTHVYLSSVQDNLLTEGIIVDPSMPVHPTFLYESIWCLVGFCLLAFYMKRRKFDGEIAIFYAIWYGIGRFFIEGVRTDSLMSGFFNLRVSQLVAAASVIGGIILWIIFKKKNIGLTPPLPKQSEKVKTEQNLVESEEIVLTNEEKAETETIVNKEDVDGSDN